MSEKWMENIEKGKLVILYTIAIIAIVYGGVIGNLVSFVFGVVMLVWIILLRLKAWGTDKEGEEDVTEVDEENENKTDE